MSEAAKLRCNTAAIRVGRLLEVRVNAGYRTIADVEQLFDAIDGEIARLPHSQRIVTVADWRRIPVMSPEAAARVGNRMALLNPRTQRSAALVPPDAPVAVLQFVRVVREANFPDRKIFDETNALSGFLREVLTPRGRASTRLSPLQAAQRPRAGGGSSVIPDHPGSVAPTYDDPEWPLFVVRMPRNPLSTEAFRVHLEALREPFRRRRPFAVMIVMGDHPPLSAGPTKGGRRGDEE